MKIETLDKAIELRKRIETLQAMEKDATVGGLFLSTIRKKYPREALQETADILKDRLHECISKLEVELDIL